MGAGGAILLPEIIVLKAQIHLGRSKGPLDLWVTSKRFSCFVVSFQAVNFFQKPTVGPTRKENPHRSLAEGVHGTSSRQRGERPGGQPPAACSAQLRTHEAIWQESSPRTNNAFEMIKHGFLDAALRER